MTDREALEKLREQEEKRKKRVRIVLVTVLAFVLVSVPVFFGATKTGSCIFFSMEKRPGGLQNVPADGQKWCTKGTPIMWHPA